ncbi:hypothetical protein L6452_02554 [Arctium lappa]|uniref:Uncharacterized protein n=1 Tax=Arctium lappa TaxID=4217 RepID=A0ACB9FJR6_ARCLA|nr:hypothetical protein L6452_02554 [Arctium lappa]
MDLQVGCLFYCFSDSAYARWFNIPHKIHTDCQQLGNILGIEFQSVNRPVVDCGMDNMMDDKEEFDEEFDEELEMEESGELSNAKNEET